MKINGVDAAEFSRAWDEVFGDNWYCHSDVILEPEDFDPEVKYDLTDVCPQVTWQPTRQPEEVTVLGVKIRLNVFGELSDRDLTRIYKAWRGDSVTMLLTVDKGRVEEVKALLKAHKIKVKT